MVCLAFISSCNGTKQTHEDQDQVKEASPMIQIQNFTVTEETLSFDYKVTNPFIYDIRVCQDISFFGHPHVVTRIDNEMVWIKLRCHLERDTALRNPPPITKYLRLTPGESYSDRISLGLPIRDASPINLFNEYERKERKQISLHRVIFEVGYLGGELNQFFSREKIKDSGPDKGFQIMGGLHYLKTIPLVVDEMQDGRLREFVYVHTGSPIGVEYSAEIVIDNVNVPCSIAVD
jgi:hypothetical protein